VRLRLATILLHSLRQDFPMRNKVWWHNRRTDWDGWPCNIQHLVQRISHLLCRQEVPDALIVLHSHDKARDCGTLPPQQDDRSPENLVLSASQSAGDTVSAASEQTAVHARKQLHLAGSSLAARTTGVGSSTAEGVYRQSKLVAAKQRMRAEIHTTIGKARCSATQASSAPGGALGPPALAPPHRISEPLWTPLPPDGPAAQRPSPASYRTHGTVGV
jgi:hypothetical protein